MECYQCHTIVALQQLSIGPSFILTFLSVSMGRKCLKLILNNIFYQINVHGFLQSSTTCLHMTCSSAPKTESKHGCNNLMFMSFCSGDHHNFECNNYFISSRLNPQWGPRQRNILHTDTTSSSASRSTNLN